MRFSLIFKPQLPYPNAFKPSVQGIWCGWLGAIALILTPPLAQANESGWFPAPSRTAGAEINNAATELFYELSGDPSQCSHVVVLANGLSNSLYDFELTVRHMHLKDPKLCVLRYDSRNQGVSLHQKNLSPEETSYQQHAYDLVSLLGYVSAKHPELKPIEKSLIGVSFGGGIILAAGSLYSSDLLKHRVKLLLPVSPYISPIVEYERLARVVIQVMREHRLLWVYPWLAWTPYYWELQQLSDSELAFTIGRTYLYHRWLTKEPATYLNSYAGWSPALTLEGMFQNAKSIFDFDGIDSLARIPRDLRIGLVMMGEDEYVASHHFQGFIDRLPSEQAGPLVLITNSRHKPHMENPVAFAELLLENIKFSAGAPAGGMAERIKKIEFAKSELGAAVDVPALLADVDDPNLSSLMSFIINLMSWGHVEGGSFFKRWADQFQAASSSAAKIGDSAQQSDADQKASACLETLKSPHSL